MSHQNNSMMHDIQRLQEEARQRLNFTEPQYPPDLAFIKADRVRLQSYLDDRDRIERVVNRGTPRFRQRFNHFGMTQEDADKMQKKELDNTQRTLSNKDSYLNGSLVQKKYKFLHNGVQKTNDLLELLQPGSKSQMPKLPPTLLNVQNQQKEKGSVTSEALNYNDDRFYAKLKLMENQVGESMRKHINQDMMNKQQKLNKDPIEGPKLKQIKLSLGPSPALHSIDHDNAEFEMQTDRDFNFNMNTEAYQAELVIAEIKIQEERRRKALGVSPSPRQEASNDQGGVTNRIKSNSVMGTNNDNVSQIDDKESHANESEDFYPSRVDFKFTKRTIQPVLNPGAMGLRVSPAKIRMVKQLLLPRMNGTSRSNMSQTMQLGGWKVSKMNLRNQSQVQSKTMINFNPNSNKGESMRSFSIGGAGGQSARQK